MIDLLGNQGLKLDTVELMKRFGGSFVKALAECILRADQTNLKKLQDAFGNYISQYNPSNWKEKT